MKNKRICLSVGILSLTSFVITVNAAEVEKEQERPNLLFILADDYGWNDLGCMGSKYYGKQNLDSYDRIKKNFLK